MVELGIKPWQLGFMSLSSAAYKRVTNEAGGIGNKMYNISNLLIEQRIIR